MESSKTQERKFSRVERVDENEVVIELQRLIYSLANRYQDPDNVMMEFDEIVGELMFELAKGIKYYQGLPKEQLLAVLRRMLDNRISELKFRFYVSGRRIPVKMTISLEMIVTASDPNKTRVIGGEGSASDKLLEEIVEETGSNVEAIYESMERVERVRSKLTDVAKMVFDAVVFGNEQLSDVMFLSAVRAAAVFKNKKVEIKSRHVADALLMNEKEVRKAFREIRTAYAEVYNG